MIETIHDSKPSTQFMKFGDTIKIEMKDLKQVIPFLAHRPESGEVLMSNITLYGYWRSSAAYRVRVALNYKGLAYQQKSIHLVKNGGEQHTSDFKSLNPSQLVPVLVDGDMQLNQSLAIIDYLDETYPTTLLTPLDKQKRYLVKEL